MLLIHDEKFKVKHIFYYKYLHKRNQLYSDKEQSFWQATKHIYFIIDIYKEKLAMQ